MSDDLKESIERATGDKFISWYNNQHNLQLRYSATPKEAPDLIYRDGQHTVALEITLAWYDQEIAKGTMKLVRKHRDAPNLFSFSGDMECALAQDISERIKEKCLKDYGDNCLLIIRIASDALSTLQDITNEVIPALVVPERNPFRGIYVTDRTASHFWTIETSEVA